MMINLPGDVIEEPSSSNASIIGYGLNINDGKLTASQPGALRSGNNKVWLNVHSRRYIPYEGDRVIGIVVSKVGDYFRIDIGTAELALINFVNFEGATKRNRPSLRTGDIIYGMVFECTPRTEAELTCVDDEKKARGMGLLNGGFLFKVSLNYARRLLNPKCMVLKTLGNFYKFEITIGLNGRIWIKADNNKEIISIYNIILTAEHSTGDDLIELVKDVYSKTT